MNISKHLRSFSIIAVLGLCLPSPVQSGHRNDSLCPECKKTANLALWSSLAELRSDYYLALGRASTFNDEDVRDELKEEARETYFEDYALAKTQYSARLQICQILNECRYDPVIDPANFLTPAEIAAHPNPYFPMIPGTTYRYRGETDEGEEIIEVTFTDDTRDILGVPCIVARDTVWLNGEVIEDTFDWYTQDREGNVWYFGELTVEFEDGEIVGLEGSFEAGVDGGKPGLIMRANPQVGDAYRQEMFLREAEDWAQVTGSGETVAIEAGVYENCLKTANYNPTGSEPFLIEDKYYAPGVGFILETKPDGERVELISIEHPAE